MFALIFGDMLDNFSTFGASSDILPSIKKTSTTMAITAVAVWAVSYIEIVCFTIAVRVKCDAPPFAGDTALTSCVRV